MMTMNPDGCNQRSFYGSGSFWPNGIFYARSVPGQPAMFAGIVTGHHGVRREGELYLFDTSKGRTDARGVVQRIPGAGQTVDPIVKDRLVDASKPRFLHPYPLSSKYFLVSANLYGSRSGDSDSGWNIYLVDVFDNFTLIRHEPGYGLFEPVLIQKQPMPAVIPDKRVPGKEDAVVVISDIYEGPGLEGIPRGEVSRLRLFTYTYGYQGMGGLYGVIGMDGPWDMRRMLGTVPIEEDGSAAFKVPANTPISIQPLDQHGKALQLMRSWFVARPGETLSCVGCHEEPGTTPSTSLTRALQKKPETIQPWYGPARNFSFIREVQPVLDAYCVSCHGQEEPPDGDLTITYKGQQVPYLGSKAMLKGWKTNHPGKGKGGKFTTSYFNLFRYTRHSGQESEMPLLTPMEFHAGTSELIMMLEKGHYGVSLGHEAMDRLITWVDLNRPYHGTWEDICGEKAVQAERRRAVMRQRYAGLEEDHNLVHAAFSLQTVSPMRKQKKTPQPPSAEPRVGPVPKNNTLRLPLDDKHAMDMVYVPAGSFVMGSEKGYPDESPSSSVEIRKGFWMAKYEISNEQFSVFDASHDSRHEDRHGYQFGVTAYPVNQPFQPVVRVSWEQARSFCEWLSKKSGKHVRLPTEAEWEWACRAGTSSDFYFGSLGDDFSKYANMADRSLHHFSGNPYEQDWKAAAYGNSDNVFDNWIPQAEEIDDGGFLSVDVGSYQPNAWGLYDMHGNVAEWTASLYQPYPFTESCRYTSSPPERVVRGGSWYDRPRLCRASFRGGYRPYQKVYNVGFRVIVEE
jgi:formylglycine-generating enzyme required for sulfatase activity